MKKVLHTAVVVVSALSIIGVTGSSSVFATDMPATTTDGNTIVTGDDQADDGLANVQTNSGANGGGDASNTNCSINVVIIDNGDDPQGTGAAGSTDTDGDCPPATTTPTTPDTPGMGAGTPETPAAPAAPVTPAAPAPKPYVLPSTGANPVQNLLSTVISTVTAGAGLLWAGRRTIRG